jgi:hypothetical protein
MKEKINLIPRLKDILNGCYDPKGGYAPSGKLDNNSAPILEYKPWGEGHQPGGEVSLSPADYSAFTTLCKQLRYKPEGIVTELGGGGAMIEVRDFAAVMAKTTAETAVEIEVEVPE